MTTDTYINDNKTATFKKGDRVEMHGCYEASFDENKGKIWTCQTDSYLDRGKQDVVFLEGFSGCFSAKYLKNESKPFDFETNFVICQCEESEIYDSHLGDAGYDWCKTCERPLGVIDY